MALKGTVREIGVKQYYADRGLSQFSVVMRVEEKARLRELTKRFNLPQADVMQAIFELAADGVEQRLTQMEELVIKRVGRQVSIAAQVKKATPEQLCKILELLAGT